MNAFFVDCDGRQMTTGVSIDVALPIEEAILARQSLRQYALPEEPLVRSFFDEPTTAWLGIGGPVRDREDLWSYFHNCHKIGTSASRYSRPSLRQLSLFFIAEAEQIVGIPGLYHTGYWD